MLQPQGHCLLPRVRKAAGTVEYLESQWHGGGRTVIPQSKGFDQAVFETELLQSAVSRFYVLLMKFN